MTPMTRPNRPRTQRRTAMRHAASALTLACLLLAVLSAVNPTAGFSPTDTARSAGDSRKDACALIVGPAKAYCLRTTTPPTATPPPPPSRETNVWVLVPPAVGLLTLALLRRRAGRC
ncbi:hypothetical protein [Streptomyces sp. BA2]|uniref:hypothetical protein n=1 Tax=Streptomyces sp. BA2 TaxID=436595 RepID=UPI0013257F06|nr:hypothetical protein [Streptomyces sp. BA2]MWA07674.1 hypothetical protein [Streptomyces sp. BA2]